MVKLGKKSIFSENVKILDISFMTPAKVNLVENGVEKSVMVSVDLINRKVFGAYGEELDSDKFFAHLDNVNYIPDDFYTVSDDTYDTVSQAKAEHDEMYQQNTGDLDVGSSDS